MCKCSNDYFYDRFERVVQPSREGDVLREQE